MVRMHFSFAIDISTSPFRPDRTATGLQNVEEFYFGVSMNLEFQFDKPSQKNEFSATLTAGDQKLDVSDLRFNNEACIFRTKPKRRRPMRPPRRSRHRRRRQPPLQR